MGIRTLWRKLWAAPTVARSPNAECPECGAPVVVASSGHAGVALGGSMMSPRPREELVAACAEHGHPPFNANTLRYITTAGKRR